MNAGSLNQLTQITPYEEVMQLLRSLNTVAGWGAVVALILLLVCLAMRPAWKWGVISVLLYVCSLGFSNQIWFRTQLIAPLEVLRSHGRSISIALLAALLIPTFMAQRGWRQRLIIGATGMFFVFQLIYSARLGVGGLGLRSGLGALIYLGMFIVFGMGVSRWLQDWRDTYAAVACMAWTGVIFAICTIFQLAIHPGGIIWAHRLTALGNQATQCAVFIALVLLPVCAMVIHPQTPKPRRILWGALAGVLVVFLIWTGARVGLLMGVVGVGLLFRKRLKQFAWAAILVTIFVLLATSVYQHSTIIADRLISSQNTRSSTWAPAWQQFISHPYTGVVNSDEALTIENAYLTVAARSGLIGLIPLGFVLLLVGRSLWRLQGLRDCLGEQGVMVDLATAGIMSILIGTIVEAFLLATITAPVFCFYIYLAIVAYLFDVVEANAATASLEPEAAMVA